MAGLGKLLIKTSSRGTIRGGSQEGFRPEMTGLAEDGGGYSSDPRLAELYDHVIPYQERGDVTFYVDAAREGGGPVLELGCGTGRILLPTARAGVEIVGIDLSETMLAACRRKLALEPVEVQARATLHLDDMRSFDLGSKFKLVTTPFRSFQHLLMVEEQLACLERVHRHLMPGGSLILDIFNPSIRAFTQTNYGEIVAEEPEFSLPDGTHCVRRHRILGRDHFQQITQVELLYDLMHPDGTEERLVQAFPMRHLFRYEAEHLLVRAGFEIKALYADYQMNPFGTQDPGELIFIARRR
jgi:SAM-dependent methyltransferase